MGSSCAVAISLGRDCVSSPELSWSTRSPACDRGEFEHVADAELHAALRAEGGDQFGGDQRVAAQIEERVVGADPVVAEQAGKQLRDRAVRWGSRGRGIRWRAAICGGGSAARSIFWCAVIGISSSTT